MCWGGLPVPKVKANEWVKYSLPFVPFRERWYGSHSFWVNKNSLGWICIGRRIKMTPASTKFIIQPFQSSVLLLNSTLNSHESIVAKPQAGDHGKHSAWAGRNERGHPSSRHWQYLTKTKHRTLRPENNRKWDTAIKWDKLSHVRNKLMYLGNYNDKIWRAWKEKILISERIYSLGQHTFPVITTPQTFHIWTLYN